MEIESLLNKVKYTVDFAKGEFPSLKEVEFDVYADPKRANYLVVKNHQTEQELKLFMDTVEQEGDGEYYLEVRNFLKEAVNE